MKVKLLKGIGIDGKFPKIGEVVEVADRFGRELINRGAARQFVPKAKPTEPAAPVKDDPPVVAPPAKDAPPAKPVKPTETPPPAK